MTSVTRLIDFFVPKHYQLDITLDEKNMSFEGSVVIEGESPRVGFPIKLHAKDLTITRATIDDESVTWSEGKDDELTLETTVTVQGKHVVSINFNGKITDTMHGIYPCYFEHGGKKKKLFATQFESHHAREAFPCIDEPAAKATFDLRLTTNKDIEVLSNTPIRDQAVLADRMHTSFETTPRMSTYLLAFVTGELQKKTGRTNNGIEVNVFATPAQSAASLDFPLEEAIKTIDFYEEYFDTPYPLQKSDHVALPDFTVGAMENWGLITYREIALLADPEIVSVSSKQYVATVITHELAHQWFGNLVTMQWWNDLWLNESFATLMEYLAVDANHPDWNIWLDFATHESIIALRRDSIDGVQSVQIDVNHPDEINTIFDGAIVYAKGARLLRMIQHYIGNDSFRAGLKQYFKDHAYKNTVGDQLWDALSAASKEPINDIMNRWISQPGYPVITIVRDDDGVTLKQKQFFVGPYKQADRLWPVPLDADDSSAPALFDSREIQLPTSKPLRINRADSAHFITNYDELSRNKLIEMVGDGTLDTIGRVQLINESTLLARGGVIGSEQLIPLLDAFQNETLEPVWDMIAVAIAELRKFVEDNEGAEKKLRQLSAKLVAKEYARLGWDAAQGESEEDTKLRANIIGLTLYGEVPEALEKARSLYESAPLEKLNAELRPLIIGSVAKYGDGTIVDSLLDAYKSTQSGELRQDICAGITSTRVPEKIHMLLDTIKDSDTIRPQDATRWFVYLIRGRDSRDTAWKWLRDNWGWIEEKFSSDKMYDDFPRYSASALLTRKHLEEYKQFFVPLQKVTALSRVISMGTSEIEGRVELIERDKDAVQKALLNLDTKA